MFSMVGAVCGGLLSGTTASAAAEGKATPENSDAYYGVPADVVATMKAQAKPSEAAQLLMRTLPAVGGYMNVLLDDDSVVLRWKGELPKVAAAAVEQAREIASVRVEPAAYSYAELDKAAQQVADTLLVDSSSWAHTVTIMGDGSGLRVGTEAETAVSSVPEVGVPIEVVTSGELELMTRTDDSAPWWGGSVMNNTNGRGNCSSAFPVTNAGGEWMLTAAHCGSPGDAFNDGVGERMGLATQHENWQHDVLLVGASVTGPGRGLVHTGGMDQSTSVRIGGWAHAVPGEVYCQSGVTTARTIGSQLCGLTVHPDFTKRVCGTDSDGDYTCVSDLASASTAGGTSVRPGDSGGPVYGLSSDNRAFARGLVSGTPDGGRTLYFQDYATVFSDFGVYPVTPS